MVMGWWWGRGGGELVSSIKEDISRDGGGQLFAKNIFHPARK